MNILRDSVSYFPNIYRKPEMTMKLREKADQHFRKFKFNAENFTNGALVICIGNCLGGISFLFVLYCQLYKVQNFG